MNKFQVRAGREGLYQVMQSRALHWPNTDGKPVIWARAGQFVDLRSPFLCELVQTTGQLHKLKAVEAIPAGGVLLRDRDAPAIVRAAMAKYEAGSPADTSPPPIAPGAPRPRTIDAGQLPSAKASSEEPEKPAKPVKAASKAAAPPKPPVPPPAGSKAKGG